MDKILMTYVMLIKKGEITLDEVPEDYREEVSKKQMKVQDKNNA